MFNIFQKQYIFVYRALMEHAQFSDTEIEIRHLRDHYELLKEKAGDTDKTGLAIEFEVSDCFLIYLYFVQLIYVY